MNAFDRAVMTTLRTEGNLSNDPQDHGGITKFGISIVFAGSIHLDIDGDGRTTQADIKALTLEQAKEIYRKHFWEVLRCDNLPPALALCVFDCGVNHGIKVPARFLQRLVGAKEDGIIGPETLQKLQGRTQLDLVITFQGRRGKRYSEASPDQLEHFGRGWYNRLATITLEAGFILKET